jgi:hypothetical protein
MKWCTQPGAATLLVGALAVLCTAGEVGDYLAKNGQLKEAVTVRIGNCLVPGEVWIINPSGDWAWKDTDSKGKLGPKQLAALAQHFATQDFHSLPKSQGYEDANGLYQHVVIAFGKKETAFYTNFGESPADYLPKPGAPNSAAWSRFIALELILADLLQMSEVRSEEYGINTGRRSQK